MEHRSDEIDSFIRGQTGAWLPPIVTIGDGSMHFTLGAELALQTIYADTLLDNDA